MQRASPAHSNSFNALQHTPSGKLSSAQSSGTERGFKYSAYRILAIGSDGFIHPAFFMVNDTPGILKT
jgi:hypothetical protein